MKKILFIDDESDLRDLFRIFISMMPGIEYLEAQDGLEGVALAKREKPDVIIVDYKMPKMTGIETLKELKQSVLTEQIPVIMYTAFATAADVAEALKLGCEEVINKPVDIRTWEQKLREYIGD